MEDPYFRKPYTYKALPSPFGGYFSKRFSISFEEDEILNFTGVDSEFVKRICDSLNGAYNLGLSHGRPTA